MGVFLEKNRENEKDISFFVTGVDYFPHYHNNLEIHYALVDNFTVVINGDTHILNSGDIAIINSYDIHSTKGIGSICILIPFNFLTSINEYIKNHPLKQNIFYDKDSKIKDILFKFDNPNLTYLHKISILYEFFAEIYNSFSNKKQVENTLAKEKNNSLLIRDIINYINENYSQKITLEFLADKFQYSKSHISHSINKYLACNLNTFINIVRLKKFVEKIKDEQKSKIITLAYECGFESLQTFYRNFKEVYNCTPIDYLKELKNN